MPTSRRILLALLIAGAVINYADRQIIAILKPLIGIDFRWSDLQYGELASAFQFASAFGLLFAGWFVDRIGIRWANPLAVGGWSLIAMAQAAARTLAQFGAMRIALGAAEALGTPVLVKSIATLFKADERSLAFGWMNAASTLGAIATPLLVPFLAVMLGWRGAFLLVGGSGLVWVAVWISAAHRSDELGAAGRAAASSARTPWSLVLRDRRTWTVAGAKLWSDQTWWFLLFWAPDWLHRRYQLDVGQTAVPLALMYSCAAAGAVMGGLGSRQLIRRGVGQIRARKITLSVCAVLALPVASIPGLGREWLTVAVLGVTLAAHQGFSANLFALITDIVPSARLATVTGIGSFSGNMGGMGVLALTGWILTEHGSYAPVFWFAAVSYSAACCWIHWMLPEGGDAPVVGVQACDS